MRQRSSISHILLADDDRDHALVFHRIMQTIAPDIKVSHVGDGRALLEFLRFNKIDLLFLDLNMPCRNGYECLREIRNNPSLCDMPVIVYSGSAHMTDIQKSFIHKADFYMVKPFNSDHLRKALGSILTQDWRQPAIRNHYFINNRFVPFTASA